MMPRTSQLLVFLVGSYLWLPTTAWLVLSEHHLQKSTKRTLIPRHYAQSFLPSSRPSQSVVTLSDTYFPIFDASPLIVVAVALGLGVTAQGFINQMLEGDQGLGAYLKDGSGYNKSGFRKASSKGEKGKDPLPWLKLPQLDFVEVAGQPSGQQEQAFLQELESLRLQMNEQLGQGKVLEATMIREKLEALMKEAGLEYNADQ